MEAADTSNRYLGKKNWHAVSPSRQKLPLYRGSLTNWCIIICVRKKKICSHLSGHCVQLHFINVYFCLCIIHVLKIRQTTDGVCLKETIHRCWCFILNWLHPHFTQTSDLHFVPLFLEWQNVKQPNGHKDKVHSDLWFLAYHNRPRRVFTVITDPLRRNLTMIWLAVKFDTPVLGLPSDSP